MNASISRTGCMLGPVTLPSASAVTRIGPAPARADDDSFWYSFHHFPCTMVAYVFPVPFV